MEKLCGMKIDDLPSPEDRKGILEFARQFNGYDYYGSFSACAHAAKASSRKTLLELQTELFFSYRASNHLGTDGFVELYAELKPFFEKILSNT